MELITSITIIVITVVVALVSGIIGVRWISFRSIDPNVIKEQENYYVNLIADYKKEINRLRSKASYGAQQVKIDGDYNLDNDDDIVSLTKSILPVISDFLPEDIQKKLKPIINNPDIVGIARDIFAKHPDDIKGLLNAFLKKDSTTTSSDEAQLKARAELIQSHGA